MKLPKSVTTVTPFSKFIALILFIALPFGGFYAGIKYEQAVQTINTPVPTPYNVFSAAPAMTNSWKTYTIDILRIQFQYPSDWFVSDYILIFALYDKNYSTIYDQILSSFKFTNLNK